MEVIKGNDGKLIIKFDKAPEFLYFNENGDGCGQIYIKGERFKGIQRVKIESETRTNKVKVCFKYAIQHILSVVQPNGKITPTIAMYGNMNEPIKEIE